MKHLILIILSILSIQGFSQIQYNTERQLVYVRTCNIAGKKPLATDLSTNIFGYNSADSVLYSLVNGAVTVTDTYYPYSAGKKKLVGSVVNAVPYKFSTVKKMYYYLYNDIAGNKPIVADFPTSIYRCINTTDSLEYDKYNGLVRTAFVRYPYQPYKSEEVIPEFITRIYVSPTGNDESINAHNPNTPYKTIWNACARTVSGDTIMLTEGTFYETKQCFIPVGVSMIGEGNTSVIVSNYVIGRVNGTASGSINLISPSEGTNGNQTLGYFKLIGTGSPNGTIGIVVKRRSNVIIHDLTVFDFEINGISVLGAANEMTIPTTYSTGNQLYNCDIRKCGTADPTYSTWKNAGLIKFAGQNGMLIHDNYFSNKERAFGLNDNIVSVGYANKGCKYYNNESHKPDSDGVAWNIHIESWNIEGGFEIYNNNFIGGDMGVDCAGYYANKNSYSYTYSIHDNYFAPNVKYGDNVHPINAICIEGLLQQDIYVYNNHFYKHPCPIVIQGTSWGASITRNIYVYRNLFEACGINNANQWDNIMYVGATKPNSTLSNINITNNTIVSDISRNCGIKIQTGPSVTLTTLNYKNNIVLNCTNGGFMSVVNDGTITTLAVTNNLLYANVNSNLPKFYGNAVSGYTISNNVNLDPKFVSSTNFHLQVGSPAIGAATDGGNIGVY